MPTSTSHVNEEKPWLKYYPEWTDHSLEYGNATLNQLYDDNLSANAAKIATRFFGRTQTFGELDREVRRAAAGLKAFGVRPGDRVAIMLPNCPQHVAAYFAVLKLGGVVVEHNPLYTAHELKPQFEDHGARIAIVWDKTAGTLEQLRRETPLETVVSVNMTKAMPRTQQLALRIPLPKLREARASLTGPSKNTVPWEALTSSAIGGFGGDLEPPAEITPDSPAVILYTSGTTGTPKGAALTHANLIANPVQGRAWVKELQEGNQRMLATLPFFHAYGLTFSLTLTILIGSELILLPAPKMDLIMQAVKKTPPTFVPGVPTVFERIVTTAREQHVDMSKVKIGFSGASSLPASVIDHTLHATLLSTPAKLRMLRSPDIICDKPSAPNFRRDFKPSILIDFELQRPMELEPIFGNIIRRARQLGVDTPRLDLIITSIKPSQLEYVRRSKGFNHESLVQQEGVYDLLPSLNATGSVPTGPVTL